MLWLSKNLTLIALMAMLGCSKSKLDIKTVQNGTEKLTGAAPLFVVNGGDFFTGQTEVPVRIATEPEIYSTYRLGSYHYVDQEPFQGESCQYGEWLAAKDHPEPKVALAGAEESGQYVVCLDLKDAYDNKSPTGFSQLFLDRRIPQVEFGFDSQVFLQASDDFISLAGDAFDQDSGVRSIEISLRDPLNDLCLNQKEFSAPCPYWISAGSANSWKLELDRNAFQEGQEYELEARIKDAVDNLGSASTKVSFKVLQNLDAAFKIEQGADFFNQRKIKVQLVQDNGVVDYLLTENCDSQAMAGLAWLPYPKNKIIPYELTPSNGAKILCMKVRNELGQISDNATGTITLDTEKPTIQMTIATTLFRNSTAGASTHFSGQANELVSQLQSLQFSLQATGGNCLNTNKSAFDATCPHAISLNNPAAWSFNVLDNLFVDGSSYQLSLSATDAAGNQSDATSASFTWDQDRAPVVADSVYPDLAEDTFTSLTLAYSDADGDLAQSCTVNLIQGLESVQPCSCSNGVCTVGLRGTINFYGAASFNYKVTTLGVESNVAVASFTVTAVNDGPSISDVGAQNIAEDATTGPLALTISDVETNLSCATSLSASSSDLALVPNTNIVFGGLAPNCSVTVTPVAASNGISTITLTVSDGSLQTSDAFILTVIGDNDAPTISDVANQTINEDANTGALAVNIADIDSTLTCAGSLSAASSDTTLLPVANILIAGTAPSCTVTATPVANLNGAATITLTVSDGSLSVLDTIALSVNAVNDAPTISDVGDQSINEDASTGALAVSIADIDNIITCAGSLSAASSNTTLLPVANIVIAGTAPSCTVTATPVAGLSGSATITLTADDGALTAQDTTTLTVSAVNDAPTISDVADQNINEDADTGALAVSIADVDNTLTCAGSLSAASSNTTLLPVANIVIAGTAPSCTVTATPVANLSGAATITLTVTDGSLTAQDSIAMTVGAQNDAPILSDVANQTILEDATTGALAVSIADVDNTLTCAGSLSATSSDTTLLPVANIVIAGTAPSCTVTATPASNLNGSATITLTVTDGALTAQDTIALTVSAVNDAPNISDVGNQTINEDGNTGALAVSISDVDNTLTCAGSLSAASSNTTLLPVANIVIAGTAPACTVTATPVAALSGNATITLTVTDGSLTAQDFIALTVSGVNDAPTISDVANQTINEDGNTGALAVNIADIDSTLTCAGSLSAASSDTTLLQVANIVIAGTAPSCSVTASPVANLSGSATITLTVTDGSLTAQDTIALTVNAVNDTPTISDVADQSISEDGNTGALAVSIADVDSTLTCAGSLGAASSNTTLLPVANIVIGGTAPSCTVTATPVAGLDGSAVVTLTASDGTASSQDAWTLNVGGVNDAPTISNVADQTINEDANTGALAVSIADVDNSLTCAANLSAASSNTTLLPVANIVIAGTAPSCTVTATPVANLSGSATITLTVTDGSLTAQDTIALTVNAVNDAPTISDVADQSILEDANTGALAVSIADVESTLTCAASLSAASSNTTLLPVVNIVIAGSAPSCTVTATPVAGLSGSATITLTADDGSLTAQDTIALTVGAVNDAPTISDVADQSINEDANTGALAVSIADVDNTLTCAGSLTAASSNTTLLPNANIVIAGTAPSCSVTLTAVANLSGSATVTMTVSDGLLSVQDTIALTVTAVNDAPTISDVANQTINEDANTGALAVNIADNETAITCAGSLSAASSNTTLLPVANIVIAGTAPSCTVTATPVANLNGSATITLTVTDTSLTAQDTIALTVNAVNDSPTISDVADQSISEDGNTGALAVTIGDIDNTLTCAGSLSSDSSNTTLLPNANIVIAGTLPNCTVTATPAAGLSGSATITMTVTDGTLSAQDTIALTVGAVNDAPTISNVADQTINEDANTGALGVSIADVDSTLTCAGSLSAASSNTTLLPIANIVIAGTAPSCTVTATPVANLSGSATITLTVTDTALTADDTIALTVTAVNDAPTISDVANQTINEDANTGALAVSIADIDSTLTCAGSLSAASSNTTLLPVANIVIAGTSPSCTVTATPVANLNGSATITLTATDGALTAQDTIALTVNAVNDAPTISDVANQNINEDANTSALAVTIGDIDHTLTCAAALSGSSSNTTKVPNANIVVGGTAPSCTVTITPAAHENGSATITLTVSDGAVSVQDTLILTINSVNDAPTISNVADQTIDQDTNTGALAVSIADVDHTLICGSSLSGSSSNTTLLPNANIVFGGTAPSCTVTITPAAGQIGNSTVTLIVSDGTATAQDTIALVVASTGLYYVEDFESTTDWTLAGAWECGVPSNVGPSSAHSGTKVCGTDLDAAYPNDVNDLLTSPIITFAGATEPILDFWIHYDTEFKFDGGAIEIRVDENGAGSWGAYYPIAHGDDAMTGRTRTLDQSSSDLGLNIGGSGWSGQMSTFMQWDKVSINLFDLTGNLAGIDSNDRIQVRFRFYADGSVVGAGFYVDDMQVIEKEAAPSPSSYPYAQNFDTSTGWSFSGEGGMWEFGSQANSFGPASGTSGSTVLGTKINAPYQSFNVFQGAMSPRIDLTGSTDPALRFNMWLDAEVATSACGTDHFCDGGALYLSVNSGSWIMVQKNDTGFQAGSQAPNSDSTTGAGGGPYHGWAGHGNMEWKNVQVNLLDMSTTGLTSIDTDDIIQVAFVFLADNDTSGFGGWYIDDFALNEKNPGGNDAPMIVNVYNQVIDEDSNTGALAVKIGDVDSTLTCAGSLSKSSSNTTLVPTANIVIAGTAPDCTVTVTPVAELSGSANITLTVSDGSLSANDIFTLTVNSINDYPTISNVADQTINEDANTGALAVTIADADHTLTCAGSLSKSSSNTTLLPVANIVIAGTAPNCTVTATPVANLSGSATITLTVTDGTLTADDTIALTVNAVNDTPTISDVANQTINEDANTGALAVTIGDVETTLTCAGSLSAASSNTTLLPNANIVIGGTAPSCTVTATPAANQNGSATVTLTVSDGTATAQDTLTLTVNAVNDAPTISNVADQTINEDANTGALAVTIGDLETAVTCTGSLSGSSSNTTILPHANIVLGGTAPNCTVTITPAANQNGSVTITLNLSDGTINAQDTIAMTVTAVNDTPVISDIANKTIGFSSVTYFTISDVETTLTCSGSVSVGSSNSTVLPTGNITFSGTAPNCAVTTNAAISQTGTSTLTLTVSDGALTAQDTFVATVCNNCWVVQPQPSGTTGLLSIFAIDVNTAWVGGVGGLIVRTTDGGNSWTVQTSGTTRDISSLQFLNASLGWAASRQGALRKTTDSGTTWSGLTSGTSEDIHDVFFIDANTGWFVTKNGGIRKSTNGGTSWSSQTSPAGEVITVVEFINANTGWIFADNGALGKTVNGGTTWSSVASGTGDDFFTGKVWDNDRIWAIGKDATIRKTINAGTSFSTQNPGISNDILASHFVNSNTGWVASSAGEIRKTVNGGTNWSSQTSGTSSSLNGAHFVDANHGRVVGASGTVLRFYGTQNAVPTISAVADQTINEDSNTGALAFTIGDTETSLTCAGSVTGTSSNTTLLPNANIVIAGSAPNCTATMTPVANGNGTSSVILAVSDGSLTQEEAIFLTITSVNDAPTISSISDQTIDEDASTGALAVSIADIDSTLTCVGNLSAASSNTTLLPVANIVIAGTAPSCTVTATPVANLNGTATITLTVSDGALSAQDTIALTVTPVNDVPTVSDVANQTINEDGNTGNLAVTIGDPDSTLSCAGSLTASSSNTTLIPNGNLVIGGSYPNCTVLATAAANLSGSSTITLTASDGVLSAQDTYTVTINAVNDAPTISDVADQTINEDSNTGALTVTIGDVDHSLTCGSSLSGSSSNTTIVPHANIVFAGSAPTCSVTITPAANQNGSATITLTVSDGSATAQDTLSLIVSSINDAPTISNVADQNIYQNANTGALTVTIADVDHSLTCGSSLSGSSSNTTLLPSANIVFAGSLPNCTVTLTPAASQTGSATATLTVSDGTATAQDTILLTVFIPPDLLDNDATATGFGGGTISTVTDVASGYLALKAYSSATDRQYLMSQDFVSSQNLVSYWAFSGNHMDAMFALGTVADTSGYGNDLVITDPSRWLNYMNSAIGVGVNFGDDGCLLSLTNANAGVDLNPGGGDFSFAMWVKKTSGATANTYRPFLYLYSAGNMGIGIALEVLGSDRFNMWVSDGTDNLEVISVPSILTPANGVWYHVAGTRKGSTFTFYMNGIPHGSQTNASIGSIDMTDAVLALAGPGGNDSSHFRGTLDEIIYLKRTLSQEEINSLYSRGVNTYADAAMFTSRIVDLGIPGSLQDFAVTAQAPYGLELPASSAPESEFAAYNADNALLTDLVSLWHFNGTSGSNAGTLDDAEATNDGTPNRGASGLTFQSGRFKTALRLDGVDDNVSLGNDASLQITGDHTISAWMRYESSTIGNFPCLFAKDNEGISAGFGLYVTTGFTIGHFIGNGSYNDTKTSTTIQPWEWVHVAVTHTSGAQKIYINGVQAALSQGGAFAVNPIDTGTEAKLGHCGGAYFPGSLDDVALWNRTLSSTEISALYSRGAVGLKAQVRICAQANCSDGNFVGPSGTSATYFEVDASSAGVIPALFDVSTLSGRYVQYRYWFNSIDSTNTTVMPRINEVEIVLP